MPRPVIVTYTVHPSSPATTPVLQAAIAGIRSHLPLRNLHWKSSTRTALRTIQEVNVDLVDLGEVNTIRDTVGASVLEAPLVNLCLVVCEDGEVYKNQTRNFIRDWLSLLAARRTPHAPLIVLVNPATGGGHTSGGSSKSVWGKDKGVLGKLKTDFNVGKRDRCVQLNLPPPGVTDPAAWPELINKLKESLVTAFDSAVIEREEEVKRGESQRLNVGWNFCTWFLLKESLAHSFESVNLPEDSLLIYEELEASFFQVLKEQNLTWYGIGKLGATQPGDDSLPILDPSAKPYRDLLRNSTISIFDFRIYLFARQGMLLGKLGRITEVAKRGQWFVASLTRRLREAEDSLAEHFVESWTYTACMDIVSRCDQWSQMDRPNGDYSGLVAYESARSELLDIARIQVERIGVSAGHLPPIYPFNPATSPYPPTAQDVLFESSSNGLSDDEDLAHSPEQAQGERPALTNEQLIDAQNDEKNCRALYLSLTRKTIKAYEACGKINSVVRLKADLAALALYGKDWSAAYDLSRALARDCAELLTWDPISKFALEGALQAHRHLDRERDEDWQNVALAYMRVCAVINNENGETFDKGGVELPSVLRELGSSELEQIVEGHRAFSVEFEDVEATWESGQSSMMIEVNVVNSLSVPVQVDDVSLEIADPDAERITFATGAAELRPGHNRIQARSITSVQGLYTVQGASVALGRIHFTYPRLESQARLRVRHDPQGVDVELRMPQDIKLDDVNKVVVEIRAGQADMKDLKFHLTSSIPEVAYNLQAAESLRREAVYNDETGGIDIGDLPAGKVLAVTVPYSGVPQAEYAKARVVLTYDTAHGSRSWSGRMTVFMGLPLTVNVQDFFRPDCLISHFTIASDGHEYLRIGDVSLRPPVGDSYEVEAARRGYDKPLIVTPQEPLSCLFKIRRHISGKDGEPGSPLRLKIRYRTLQEEVQRTIEHALRASSGPTRTLAARFARTWTQDRKNWLSSSLLELPLAETIRASVSAEEQELFRGFFEALGSEREESWRTLEIPVDVPQHRLLTTVDLRPVDAPGQVYEGRALAMDLSLYTSLSWAGAGVEGESGGVGRGRKLVFDIHNSEDWLVCGKKKGYFEPDPHKPEKRQVTLVPMRAGNLFLPSISVHLLHQEAQQGGQAGDDILIETYLEHAAQSIQVLPANRQVDAVVPVVVDGHWDGERM
ncbi:hypothetical protein IAU60_000502 [Kwoniella sp. DSM 27419]